MGYQSIVHGRIIINNKIEEARELIYSIGNDGWLIRTEYFGLGVDRFTYYEDPVLVFGATYKQVEYEWSDFILEFENLLRNLSFDTAKIQLETEIYGTYNFFWRSKKQPGNISFNIQDDKLIETDEWLFGYGNRSRWGTLETDLQEFEIFTFNDFKYPITK